MRVSNGLLKDIGLVNKLLSATSSLIELIILFSGETGFNNERNSFLTP